jgi:hypothetical protein
MSVSQLNGMTVSIGMFSLREFGITRKPRLSGVGPAKRFYKAFNGMLKSYSNEGGRIYLNGMCIKFVCFYLLIKEIEDQNFKFYSTIMSGVRFKSLDGKNDGAN